MFAKKDKTLVAGAGTSMLSNTAYFKRHEQKLLQGKNFDWGHELPYVLGIEKEPSFDMKIESPEGFEWNLATVVGQAVYRFPEQGEPSTIQEEHLALGNYRVCFFNVSYKNLQDFQKQYEDMNDKTHGRSNWRTKDAINMLKLENKMEMEAHFIGSTVVSFDENNTSVIFSTKKQKLETTALKQNQYDHRNY